MPTSHSKTTIGSVPAGMHQRAGTLAYNPGQLAAQRHEERARARLGLSQSTINFPRAPAVAPAAAAPAPAAPAPAAPPAPLAPTPTRFADLSYQSQLDTLLDIVHNVGRLGAAETEAKIERYLAKISPPSPAIERGRKRDPIVLEPAGKFQRLIDAARV
jgi:hypothetical protein